MRHPVPPLVPTSPLPARRRHASGPHLGSALEAAPLRSQQNILEVEFKVRIYAGHGAGAARWLPAAAEAVRRPASARGCGARAYSGAGMAVRRPVLGKPGARQARCVRRVLKPARPEPPAQFH